MNENAKLIAWLKYGNKCGYSHSSNWMATAFAWDIKVPQTFTCPSYELLGLLLISTPPLFLHHQDLPVPWTTLSSGTVSVKWNQNVWHGCSGTQRDKSINGWVTLACCTYICQRTPHQSAPERNSDRVDHPRMLPHSRWVDQNVEFKYWNKQVILNV